METPRTVLKPRRVTRRIVVGGVGIGGDEPIRVQSMTNTKTSDVAATVEQAYRLAKAGAELVRITTQSAKHAQLLAEVKKGLAARGVDVPIIADIHFVPAVAFEALKTADKVRINPGNFLDSRVWKRREYTNEEYAAELVQLEEKLSPFIDEAKKWKKPLRIGTNHGSLSDRILNRFGDTSLGMVESTLEYLQIFRKHGFEDIVVGLKASDPVMLIEANRLLVERLDAESMDYPIHLGVTEAGNGDEGRVKSTLGIATLLLDGIGDTVRVSLTEDPVAEIPVAYAILQATRRRITRAEFISCPSCGRTYYDLETVTNAIKQRLGHLRGVRIGIMGCIVNGIGEMAGADFGYVGGAPGKVNLFVGKECVKRNVPEDGAVDALIALIKAHGKWQEPKTAIAHDTV